METSGPGFDVPTLVGVNKFWAKAKKILKVFEPLVLQLVGSDNKPTTEHIYEAMDRAKLAT